MLPFITVMLEQRQPDEGYEGSRCLPSPTLAPFPSQVRLEHTCIWSYEVKHTKR